MNTEKTNFWCKKLYKDCTHHALLLNLTQHSDNPSSSAHFYVLAASIHRIQFEASQENFGHLLSKEATCPCHEEQKFCRHPITKKEKNNCKGMAKKDGRIPTMSYQQN